MRSKSINHIQRWALAYHVVREKKEARETLDMTLRQLSMFLNRDLYKAWYERDEQDLKENGVVFESGDLNSADALLAELDRTGKVTVNASVLDEWI